MSIVQASVGGVIVVGFMSLVTQAYAPQAVFMTVHSLEYEAGQITADRTVREPSAIADWRVTVVSDDEDSPTCQTIPGGSIHEGWSRYRAGRGLSEMSLDVWVGDPGCYDRLESGPMEMFVTWTPRDTRLPVTSYLKFNK